MLNHLGSQTLETERLILRKFKKADAPAMFTNWASDPEVTRCMSWNPHTSVEISKKVLSQWVKDQKQPNYYHWGIELKETGELIGSGGFMAVSDFKRSGTLGYCIGKPWWGRGLMAEAAGAMIAFVFDKVGLERVECSHFVENPNSGRVMQKCGMRHVGLCQKSFPTATACCMTASCTS